MCVYFWYIILVYFTFNYINICIGNIVVEPQPSQTPCSKRSASIDARKHIRRQLSLEDDDDDENEETYDDSLKDETFSPEKQANCNCLYCIS